MGESPYLNGFLMLTSIDERADAAKALFGAENMVFSRHEQKPYIIAYTIEKSGVQAATTVNIKDVLMHLQENAVEQIRMLKNEKENTTNHKERYKSGMSLAFWLNQLSCAMLYREDLEKELF